MSVNFGASMPTETGNAFSLCFADRASQYIRLNINQLDAQNLFYSKFISCLYMFRAQYAHRQEVKIVLYSLWCHHTETSEWSKITKITKITKIQFYKYEYIVVKFTK